MSTASSSTSAEPDSPSDGAIKRAARAAARLASSLTTAVARLSAGSAGAGLILWGLLWWPGQTTPLALFFEGLTLLLALLPAAILGLFYLGLSDVLALPDRISEHSVRTANQSAKAVGAVTGSDRTGAWNRVWQVIQQVWSLRSLLVEHRALLVRYGALIRYLNPGFLLLVIVAVGASLVLIPLAGLGLIWVAIW